MYSAYSFSGKPITKVCGDDDGDAARRGRSWSVDGTYIEDLGHCLYLHRAMDRSGALGDQMFSGHRDMAVATAQFVSAKMVTGVTADRVTMDGRDNHPRAMRTMLSAGGDRRGTQYLNNRPEQDRHGRQRRYGPMRRFKDPGFG